MGLFVLTGSRYFGLFSRISQSLVGRAGIVQLPPFSGPYVGYVDFMSLVMGSAYALTDSGGIQEETTYLGIPCLTLRENSEQPLFPGQR